MKIFITIMLGNENETCLGVDATNFAFLETQEQQHTVICHNIVINSSLLIQP